MASRVVVPYVPVVTQPEVVQLVVAQLTMSIKEQKILARFLRLDHPRCFGALGKDAFEFLIICGDMINNLGLIETYSVDYRYFNWTWLIDIGGEVILILGQLDILF